MRARLLATVLLTASAGACTYSPSFESGKTKCSANDECPSGFTCDTASGLCYALDASAGGSGGAGGTAGIAGSGGASGTAGIAGSGGTAGIAGSGGTAGIAGSGGTAGIAGSGGTAGSGAGGSGSGGSGSGGCVPGTNVIADFEGGTTAVTAQTGWPTTGWWSTFSDSLTGTLTPAAGATAAVAVTQLGAMEQTACNKWAYHTTASGHTQYVGTGAYIRSNNSQVDLSGWKGIRFRARSLTDPPTPIWVEVMTTADQPAPVGNATRNGTDMYNTHGVLLQDMSSAWTTYDIPFAIMGPRFLPNGCANTTSPLCEAPVLNLGFALGLELSVYQDFTTAGAYDLWIDDVTLLADDSGLSKITQSGSFPFPQDAAYPNCTKPAGAAGKYLVDAYLKWRTAYVVTSGATSRVAVPEMNNDTTSMAMGYGLLLAANMGDKTTFDGLWAYWKNHRGTTGLMEWRINSAGSTVGTGSATDADQDAAFALLLAAKKWGTAYTTEARAVLASIWAHDLDSATKLPKGGSVFDLSGPPLFAPAYYRVFAEVDSTHDWLSFATGVYTALARTAISGTNGLVPAWCSSGCTTRGGSGAGAGSENYNYDAQLTPWRIGLDFCWNGIPEAKAYVDKTSATFSALAVNGMGNVVDTYSAAGVPVSGSRTGAISLLGTAAVGAMASPSYSQFALRAYTYAKDALYSPVPLTTRSWANFANRTGALLALMTMSGNFAKP